MSTPRDAQRRREIILYFRVSLICLAIGMLVAGGCFYYVARTSDRLDRQAKGIARNNVKLIVVNSDLKATNFKLQRTLELVTDNGNRGACSIRSALQTARSRTIAGKRAAVTVADKAKAQQAIDEYTILIDSQRTVPLDFDCSTVIPKATGGTS